MEKKKKILIVDDNVYVRNFMRNLLNVNGFDVMEAEDGMEAVKICEDKGHTLDAIVCDLIMPHMNGLEFAKYNYENRFLPLVVCTAVANAQTARDLLKYGVHDYILKPFSNENFMEVLRNTLNRQPCFPPVDGHAALTINSISIKSKTAELQRAAEWITGKIKNVFDKAERKRFVNSVMEFLLNSHEHGNLEIGKKSKTEFLEKDMFSAELKYREANTNLKIQVKVYVLGDEVVVRITDEGKGFDYKKYLDVNDNEFFEKLEIPNGRGIVIAARYFESVCYSNNGASVLLTKNFNLSAASGGESSNAM